jgi:hypothetical protein
MVPVARTIQTVEGAANIGEARYDHDDSNVSDARGSLALEGSVKSSNAWDARLCAQAEPFLRRTCSACVACVSSIPRCE